MLTLQSSQLGVSFMLPVKKVVFQQSPITMHQLDIKCKSEFNLNLVRGKTTL